MAKLDNNLFRLRVELSDTVAMFTFLYFEKKYKVLTYAFLPIECRESQLFKTIGGWTEIRCEKAEPIIQEGMNKYTDMMKAFEKEPNF